MRAYLSLQVEEEDRRCHDDGRGWRLCDGDREPSWPVLLSQMGENIREG